MHTDDELSDDEKAKNDAADTVTDKKLHKNVANEG